MVMAAASTARPTTWLPMRRVSSGNCADTSATRMGCTDGAGVGSGEGENGGKVRAGLAAGFGKAGSEADGSAAAAGREPGGNVPGGSVTPIPTGAGVLPAGAGVLPAGAGVLLVGVGVGVGFAATTTLLSEADTGAAASGADPVAVRVSRVPASVFGTGIFAASSTGEAPALTKQVAVPSTGQTVKAGESLPG